MPMGSKYGTHRVIEPVGAMPQTAKRINNDMSTVYDNEILLDVIALNIDSASFTQIETEAGHDEQKIAAKIMSIVAERGKQQNPVTGSGGMLIGKVAKIGSALKDRDLKVGDKIASLVSLSLTPLKINKITKVMSDVDRVLIDGQAILFESGIYAKLPTDMDEGLALAALDIAGAPAQTAKLVKPGDSVLVLGAGGKSGLMCCYEAMKRVGPTGRVIANIRNEKYVKPLRDMKLCHEIAMADSTKPVEVLEAVLKANNGKEVDIVINCVNLEGCEMASILPVRDNGIVYFFSMATSFTRAALGAEGIGKDVLMIIGNGYTKDHAEITLWELRENAQLRKYFEEQYVK
ncbi:MAG: L-erythro-3,5-diaminohexanoate dehydrogenase [Spirochaetes bacterium GWD1_61_31]|nr:MAG: L-erythro-3,5-diaminohexanoate dehydrogenase [Spirochaetes bacterium GWB1_60_80]OHD31266.1 MAG: L-erythro-3,5-diaminohexanoate dehydrogenase [Spirochaetes bacterium GWC1_61_12]OHD39448.1 MAG: L-erythro-3,5-diaminohexanoate dehydrogenase [Spirochaetes bacterium GWD1_61_31]OHD45501.1 MAG: L-erythro-3,5-diaminohexanoate dehydrogenase [Spirochaetes bacterium GWE1_60_18]OHD58075.1 MAG: L-erythro-3,5-diaminohexanoate dehydrogenase [Spirochaetes bacterium GWF1_60_12]HAP44643.1 L-erythro-3,5-d